MTKYKTDPLIATDRYSFLTFSIVFSKITDSYIFLLLSSEVILAYYSDSINSTLSKILS